MYSPGRMEAVLAISFFAFSGTSLTMANKIIALEFPFPSTVLLLQNGVSVPLVQICALTVPAMGQVSPLEFDKVRRWLGLELLFIGMLLSSLYALEYVTVAALIVVRNLTSLVVAAGELAVLGTVTTLQECFCLFLMAGGAALYGWSDLHFSGLGYAWLAVNVILTGSYQVYVKRLVKHVDLSALGMAYYNNLLSLPILAVVAFVRESDGLQRLHEVSVHTLVVLALSTVLGTILSVSAFALNRTISATSQMVVNNGNKFVLIIISAMWNNDMTIRTAIATGLSMSSAIAYSMLRSNQLLGGRSKRFFLGFAVVVLLVCSALWTSRADMFFPALVQKDILQSEVGGSLP